VKTEITTSPILHKLFNQMLSQKIEMELGLENELQLYFVTLLEKLPYLFTISIEFLSPWVKEENFIYSSPSSAPASASPSPSPSLSLLALLASFFRFTRPARPCPENGLVRAKLMCFSLSVRTTNDGISTI